MTLFTSIFQKQCVLSFLLLQVLACAALAMPSFPIQQPDTTIAQRDSLRIDSLKNSIIFDSIQKIQTKYVQIIENPTSQEQQRPGSNATLPALFAVNGTGTAELLASDPSFIAVPYAFSTRLTRALLFGYTTPLWELSSNNGSRGLPFDQVHGTNDLGMRSLSSTQLSLDKGLVYSRYDTLVTLPAMNIYWETGPFSANILSIDFARPITNVALLKVYSDYRSITKTSFDHNNGNIASFYQGMSNDTSYVMNNGYNPFTLEQRTGIDCSIHRNNLSLLLHYQYSDNKNDIVRADSGNAENLIFSRLVLFENQASAGLLKKGTLLNLEAGFSFDNTVSKIAAQTAYLSATKPTLGSQGSTITGYLRPYREFGSDTIGLALKGTRTEYTTYAAHDRTQSMLTTTCEYAKHMALFGPLLGKLNASAGATYAEADTFRSVKPYLFVNAGIATPHHDISLFGILASFAPNQNYDSSETIPEPLARQYVFSGVRYLLTMPSWSITSAYTWLTDSDSENIKNFWPSGIVPYHNPHGVLSIAPKSPAWYGFSLRGSFSLADQKPYLKALSTLSYRTTLFEGRQKIASDLSLVYWSTRTSDPVGNPAMRRYWEHEIFDLSISVSMQIRAFRLFYKTENILNRKFAYVPGYIMPGLVFRWGFAWFIL